MFKLLFSNRQFFFLEEYPQITTPLPKVKNISGEYLVTVKICYPKNGSMMCYCLRHYWAVSGLHACVCFTFVLIWLQWYDKAVKLMLLFSASFTENYNLRLEIFFISSSLRFIRNEYLNIKICKCVK